MEIKLHIFLTSALYHGMQLAAYPGYLFSQVNIPSYPLDRKPIGLHGHVGHGSRVKNLDAFTRN
jgi:hypothetical protein